MLSPDSMGEGGPVRFGVFEVHLRQREIRKHGIRIKLQTQPFEVLAALLERPGELVTRDELRRRIWGGDTFVEFDQGLNRAVSKLREALGDSAENPRFIETSAKRGYRFIVPVAGRPVEAAASAPVSERRLPLPRAPLMAAAVVLLLGMGFFWRSGWMGSEPAPKIVQLTTLTGEELQPAFSPDGKAIVFAWAGERRDNLDIYVQADGDPTALRLTKDPAGEGYPAWSPDGRSIAFVSFRPGGGVFVTSPFGGGERKVSGIVSDSRPAWSGDSKFLVIAAAYRETQTTPSAGALLVVPVEGGGEPRLILQPPAGTWFMEPAISPDRRSLAFASCAGSYSRPSCSIQVVALKDGLTPAGAPRQITTRSVYPQGIVWTVDSSALVYGAGGSAPGFLWRVSVRGNTAPRRLEVAGAGASYPAIDLRGGRLAFSRSLNNSDIWRLGVDGSPAAPFLTSTAREVCPQYSPDGQRIAFESGRGGANIGVWMANADGSDVRPASRVNSEQCGSPHWSPDGRAIAFDCFDPEGGWNIWAMEPNGGAARRLTNGGGDNISPSWSRNGSWIYYSAKRGDRFQIWRVPAAGGAPQQVTRNGGYIASESADGSALYYTVSEFGSEGLFVKKLPYGEEVPLIRERVARRGFMVFPDGIYYLGAAGPQVQVRFYELASGATKVVSEIAGPLQLGLAVSPGRDTFLVSKVVFAGADLMAIENFR